MHTRGAAAAEQLFFTHARHAAKKRSTWTAVTLLQTLTCWCITLLTTDSWSVARAAVVVVCFVGRSLRLAAVAAATCCPGPFNTCPATIWGEQSAICCILLNRVLLLAGACCGLVWSHPRAAGWSGVAAAVGTSVLISLRVPLCIGTARGALKLRTGGTSSGFDLMLRCFGRKREASFPGCCLLCRYGWCRLVKWPPLLQEAALCTLPGPLCELMDACGVIVGESAAAILASCLEVLFCECRWPQTLVKMNTAHTHEMAVTKLLVFAPPPPPPLTLTSHAIPRDRCNYASTCRTLSLLRCCFVHSSGDGLHARW